MAVLTSGVHPDEVRGHYTFEGFVRAILASTPLGSALRSKYTFLVYPGINSQGIWTGMIRGDIQINIDANRIWLHPTHVSEMNALYQAAIATDVAAAGRLDASIDFHDDSRISRIPHSWSHLKLNGPACIRTGRKFIGIELDQNYFQVAVNRIKAELAQGTFNL